MSAKIRVQRSEKRNLHNAGPASWLVESLAEVYSSDEQEASQQSTDRSRLNILSELNDR